MATPFCFPVKELQGDKFKITPFEEKHIDAIWSQINSPDILAHMPCGPWLSKDDFVSDFVEDVFNASSARQLYSVFTTRSPRTATALQAHANTETMAGVCAYINASTVNLQAEIGYFVIFPPFQRTGLSFAVGDLLRRHALAPVSEGGIGLRRVVWQCNSANIASQRLAIKLGFKQEGFLRWDRVFPDGVAKQKIGNGRPLPASAKPGDIGRDTVMLGRCWDDE